MMSFINWFKSLFSKKQCHCCCCHKHEDVPVIYTRRGFDIKLSKVTADDIESQGLLIALAIYKGQPSSVQVTKYVNGKTEYVGTLKKFLNVKSFKNGDILDFTLDNLIFNTQE